MLVDIRLEIDLTMWFLLLYDQNITTIHCSDQDALGTKEIVVSVLLNHLLDLLNHKWKGFVLQLLHHWLVYHVFLRFDSLYSVYTLWNLIVTLLSQDFIVCCASFIDLLRSWFDHLFGKLLASDIDFVRWTALLFNLHLHLLLFCLFFAEERL